MSQQLYLSSSPHVHSGETTPSVMRAVLYSLVPACGVAVYFFGSSGAERFADCNARLPGDRSCLPASDESAGNDC